MRVLISVAVAASALLAGCLAPNPPDGAYLCAPSGQACPTGYACIDGSCWRNNHNTSLDMSVGDTESDMTMSDMEPRGALPSSSTSLVSVQPTTVVANGTSTGTITVTVRDAAGNPMTDQQVWLSASGSGNTVAQPSKLTDARGITTGTIASQVAEPKTITAALGGASSTIVVTTTVSFAPVMPVALIFTVPPSNSSPSGVISPPVIVSAVDSSNTPITGPGVTITLTLNDVTPPTGAKLSGSNSLATTQGVAKFQSLSVDKAGKGYTLTATAGALTATSSPFDVVADLPSPPVGLMATTTNASTINLSWTAESSSTGVSNYIVKRGTSSGGPYTTIAQPTANSYTDPTLLHGTYYYVVQAVNNIGTSGASPEVSAEAHQELCVANDTSNSVVVVSGDGRDAALGALRSFAKNMKGPYFLAASPTLGEIFVANNDQFTNNVTVYARTADAQDASGGAAVRTLAGPTAVANGTDKKGIYTPQGIAYDTINDEILVVNTGSSTVMAFNRTATGMGNFNWVISGGSTNATDAQAFSQPAGITVDTQNGEVYVSNFGNDTIGVYSRTACKANAKCTPTRYLTKGTGAGPHLSGPTGVLFDNNQLFVANQGGNTVAVYSSARTANGPDNSNSVKFIQGNTDSPTGIAVDTSSIYVTNFQTPGVYIFSRAASGQVTGRIVTGAGSVNGGPTGIALCN